VPTDGVVVSGVSAVNEALVTGEPLPVTKAPGDTLIGGSVNTSGCLIMKATQASIPADCCYTEKRAAMYVTRHVLDVGRAAAATAGTALSS
jgi:magnesium-transporting ATPase (P-type)